MSTTMTSPAETLKQEITDAGYWDELQFFNIKFFEELVDYGIETLEQFEDSYQGQYISEGDFVEQILDDCYQCDLPTWVHIDYQKTWDDSLSWDYFSVQTGASRYEIFRNI